MTAHILTKPATAGKNAREIGFEHICPSHSASVAGNPHPYSPPPAAARTPYKNIRSGGFCLSKGETRHLVMINEKRGFDVILESKPKEPDTQ